MTEKTLEALTDEEWEMIKTIRENREDEGFRLLIERKHGIWKIELKSARVPNLDNLFLNSESAFIPIVRKRPGSGPRWRRPPRR
jgi:hypothetical protein